MCQIITSRFGYGPYVDKISAAWLSLGFNRSGYITWNEFCNWVRYELQKNYDPA